MNFGSGGPDVQSGSCIQIFPGSASLAAAPLELLECVDEGPDLAVDVGDQLLDLSLRVQQLDALSK